ncbi:MAG: dTDP-glucose 4,6-dehydratase [Alphaproteobacteria bacterium MarineAlpha5_Bin12]|nr:MAG: dTDP-glucose 4,6-dehydratase [Alphaproteobacteria bacterium MarineAlpha5_Bin12]|tara:strand:+ start:7750 stop:8757 length:1008 start_codon:yes stop_codon:yes gene_type:complete
MDNKKIFITGGAGYCGSRLVPRLLEQGYKITVYDIMYFGDDFLPKSNPNLNIIAGDIRDIQKIKNACKDHDTFIHLACISNDASFVLDEELSTSINLDAFEPMVIAVKEAKIKRFIYASTSSVYGVSDKPDVKEDHPLVPLTLYNDYKGRCEPLLIKHTNDDFCGVIFRPATVCGYAPRQRLDVSVNILTNYAYHKNKISVFGGDQLRPNLHIKDYCNLVELLLVAPKDKIQNQIFNVGFQNMSIFEIATLVKKVVEEMYPEKGAIDIIRTESDDNRSYHINSDKIKKILNFSPQNTIEDAVKELCEAFQKNLIPDSFDKDIYFNVKRLKKLNAK